MKFLVIRKPGIGTLLTPISKSIREHKEGAVERSQTGNARLYIWVPGGGGSVAVANADSIEQLNENLMNTALFLFSQFEIRPLTDYAKYVDRVAAAFEKQGR